MKDVGNNNNIASFFFVDLYNADARVITTAGWMNATLLTASCVVVV